MTNATNRVLPAVAAFGILSCLVYGAARNAGAERRTIPMTPDRWQTVFGNAEFKEHLGAPALVFGAEGGAVLKDLIFANGTIEFDIDPLAMGAGLGFRMPGGSAAETIDTFEVLYFRPQPGCATAPDCTQYTPFTHKVLLWDLYPHYQAPAPLRQHGWNRVKVVISGRRMHVFVNGSQSPTLAVGSLEGDAQEGRVALLGPGAFANVAVTPDAVEGLAAQAEADPTARDPRT